MAYAIPAGLSNLSLALLLLHKNRRERRQHRTCGIFLVRCTNVQEKTQRYYAEKYVMLLINLTITNHTERRFVMLLIDQFGQWWNKGVLPEFCRFHLINVLWDNTNLLVTDRQIYWMTFCCLVLSCLVLYCIALYCLGRSTYTQLQYGIIVVGDHYVICSGGGGILLFVFWCIVVFFCNEVVQCDAMQSDTTLW